MSFKTCFKCGQAKPRDGFYAHPQMADGLLGKCKECTKADARKHYRADPEARAAYERERTARPERRAKALEYQRRRRQRSPEKCAARQAVGNAIRDGRFAKLPCEVCGSVDSQAHHEDYSRPLDVRWLCFKHHRETHGQVVRS